MLDWRAATASTIVHVAMGMMTTASISWWEIVCRFPLPDDVEPVIERPRMASFILWDRVDTPVSGTAMKNGPIFRSPPCDTGRNAPMPEVRYVPPILGMETTTGSSGICLTVDTKGEVVSARIYRSSGDAARDRRMVELARRARFVPGRPGGVALTL